MTVGHAAALLLICKYGFWHALQVRLAAVGRMAFSNYIAHSFIYGFVFYGYGFNLFDKLQRYQLYYVVLGMWIFSLVWSPIWLRHFRFGPLEWCMALADPVGSASFRCAFASRQQNWFSSRAMLSRRPGEPTEKYKGEDFEYDLTTIQD